MFLSRKMKVFLFLVSILIPIEVWSQFVPSKDIEIHIVSDPKVKGDKVLLSDVAVIYAKKMQDFQALNSLVVSNFSQGQNEIRMPQEYLMARVQDAVGTSSSSISIKAPELLVFRRVQGIEFAQVAQRILELGKKENKFPDWASVEVESTKGELELMADSIGSEWRLEPAAHKNLWRGDMNFRLVSEKDSKKSIWVSARIRWFADTYQAQRTIPIRGTLKEEDFQPARVEIRSTSEQPILGSENLSQLIEGARTKRSLQAGAPLFRSLIEKSPDARMGQAMKVVFVSESGIRVSAEGSLLSPAVIGEEARVKLRSSKKIVTGRLVSGQLMEVSL